MEREEERLALKALVQSEGWKAFQSLIDGEWGADATLAKIDRALGMVDRGDTDGVADTVQQIQAARREVLKVLTLPRERLTALEAPDEDKRPFAAFRRIGR